MVHTTGSAGGFDFSPNSEHPLLPLAKVKQSVNGYDGRSGVAGSLDASIDIRVIVVSIDAVQHDYDLYSAGIRSRYTV